ncbi:MAG: right-handed parallel beta-helix repeat-containing protein [Parvularcula sp.]
MKTSLKSFVAAASSLALVAGAWGSAHAQNFGGMPTITPQDASKNAGKKTNTGKNHNGAKAPAYVVVDKGGPSGGHDRNVYRSINEAIDAVAWGGVVVVMPGTYNENVVLKRSVSLQGDRGAGQNVIVRPTDGAKPCLSFQPKHFNDHAMVSNITFRPGSTLSENSHDAGFETGLMNVASSGATPCVDVEGGIFTMVESTVDGENLHRGDLINVAGGTVLLEKNKFTGGLRGIAVHQDHALWDRTLLVDNIVSNNESRGIDLDGVASMLATGNLVNNNGIGISYNGSGPATLVGNKILNNHSHGVLLDRDGRQVLARLNQIWSNDGAGIRVVNTGGLIEDNDIDGNADFEISTSGHLDTIPTIINDVAVNKPSPRRGGWGINKPGKR